jgi:hypothetical protein
VMLVMMQMHRLRINVRLQRFVRVWQGRYFDCHLSSKTLQGIHVTNSPRECDLRV